MTEQEQIDLLLKNDPNLNQQQNFTGSTPEEQAQIDLLLKNDPGLNQQRPGTSGYDPRVNLNSLNMITPTTPVKQQPISWWDALSGAATNSVRSAKDFGLKVRDAIANPKDTANTLWEMPGAIGKQIGRSIQGTVLNQFDPATREMILKDHPKLAESLNDAVTFDKTMGYLVDRYGSVEGFKRALRDHPVETAADLSTFMTGGAMLAGKMGAKGLAAGAAATANAINPLSTTNIPARMIRAVPGVEPVIQGTKDVAGKVIDSYVIPENMSLYPPSFKGAPGSTKTAQNELLLNAAEDPAAMQQALRNPVVNVPGSNPTAGQAGTVTGSTQWAALMKDAEKQNSTPHTVRKAEQAEARLKQVNRIGGTFDPEQLRDLRKDAKTRNYLIADSINSPMNQEVWDTLNLPLNKNVLRDANDLAMQDRRRLLIGEYKPAEMIPVPESNIPMVEAFEWKPREGTLVPSTIDDVEGFDFLDGELVSNPTKDIPLSEAYDFSPAVFPKLTGSGGHDVKKAFDDLIRKAEKSAEEGSPNKARLLVQAQKEFLNWFENANPSYAVARNVHSQLSSQMDRATLRNALAASLEKSPTAFRNAQDSVLNELTGNRLSRLVSDDAQLKDILTPGEMKLNESVIADLDRDKLFAQLAEDGSEHRGKLKTAVSDYWGGRLPMGEAPTYPRQVLNWLTKSADEQVLKDVSKAAPSPEEMDKLLTEAINRRAKLYIEKQQFNALKDLVTKYPAIYNVLDEERKDERKKK